MDDSLVNLIEYKAGYARRLFLKKKYSDFAMTICHFWISACFVIISSICYWPFKCRVLHITRHVRVCVCVCERGTGSHHSRVYSPSEVVLTVACVLQTHMSIITATLFPFQALTDQTNLKAEARDYGKGSYISNACLWCSANHNVLGQLANRSRLHLLEGGAL